MTRGMGNVPVIRAPPGGGTSCEALRVPTPLVLVLGRCGSGYRGVGNFASSFEMYNNVSYLDSAVVTGGGVRCTGRTRLPRVEVRSFERSRTSLLTGGKVGVRRVTEELNRSRVRAA